MPDGNRGTYADFLRASAERTGSVLSVGYDPAPRNFPLDGVSGYDDRLPDPTGAYDPDDLAAYVADYFRAVLDAIRAAEAPVGAFKFNLGYFRMYDGLDQQAGSRALADVLEAADAFGDVPVILDAKDADIARSSAAFAISTLDLDPVDAVTVHPYMGTDSVEPFCAFAHDRGKGVYILARTTNPGARDFQDLPTERTTGGGSDPLYVRVAERIREWSEAYPGTVGAVAAGNDPADLRTVAGVFADGDAPVPLLIPGVGSQGGEAGAAMAALADTGYDHRLARINSSSGVTYRAQKDGRPHDEHAAASAAEVARLHRDLDLATHL